ncbi:hypothetical protein F8M41_020724 [Gigaspora margarita]|uniref:Uncharacterized protein n=1 Tax=Gigaspora margarita TaxID=4874 RepID=A0A8H4B1Q4_GIGMA|nr:hypothetical protein F8M41_020724 [Gigaspora margarita]
MEIENDKQWAEIESSRNELKTILAQYGTKAKVADDLERDTSKLHRNIEDSFPRVQSSKFNEKTKMGDVDEAFKG